MRNLEMNVPFKADELNSPTVSDTTISSSEDSCLPKTSHLTSTNDSPEEVTSSTSDEVFVSTWSNGELIERTPMKILLPAFVRDAEPPYLDQLASVQNYEASYHEALEFAGACLKQPREKYLRIFQLCTRDQETLKKFEKFIQILLWLSKGQLHLQNVLPLPWRFSPGSPTTVRVIHGKWKKF